MTVRRIKTYTGETGYVYQYYFVGQRPARDEAEPATEFIFDVTSDRKTTFSVSIFLLLRSVEQWEKKHDRKLVDAEQYGSVKMKLFRAFDQIERLMEEGRRLLLDPDEMEELLATLGVD